MVKPGMIFLASAGSFVIQDIAKHFPIPPSKLRFLFIDTASEAETGDKKWLKRDLRFLKKTGCKVEEYTITGQTKSDVKKKLESFDGVFVAGGNTFYLLEKIKQTGFDQAIRARVKEGMIYIGSSAGSLVMGPDISPAKDMDNWRKAPKLKDYSAIGMVPFIPMPHWGNEYFKKSYMKHRLEGSYDNPYPLILFRDEQYIWVNGEHFQIRTVK